jgi:hypothetical protein
MKSRMMRWTGHRALMGKIRNTYKIVIEKMKGRDHSEDLDVDGKRILEYILRK